MSFKTTLAAAAFGISLAPVAVSAAIIDFGSGVTDGTTFTQYSEDGFTFAVTATGKTEGAALFSTTCVIDGVDCGGDLDLVPTVQGNNGIKDRILIRQEKGISGVSDDAAPGGSIIFTLISGSRFRWEGVSAVDDAIYKFSTSLDGEIGGFTLGENETGQLSFSSSVLGVGDSITLYTNGSGGFDSLQLTAVPVPASLPLLLASAGIFGFAARRKARKA
ncbi:MAG: VPLPA-CTERM sorting domain-containing protein [Pseudomonadota bacterium]